MPLTFRGRILLVALFFFLGVSIFIYSMSSPSKHYDPKIKCYFQKSETLPSILEAQPIVGKSIFFHETSCRSAEHGKILISAREACAVESAARQNPNFRVFFIFLSPGVMKNEGTESDRYLQALKTYENIKFHHIDMGEYIQGTPVENIWKNGEIQNSHFVVSHVSDVLRYLTLWKYGGIYLDLDVVVIKSLENIPFNFAGAESDEVVNSGVLGFEPSGPGHILANLCLYDLKHNFNGTQWTRNGPIVITNLAKNQCASASVPALVGKECGGNLKIYPTETFYPVAWQNWFWYFNKSYVEKINKLTEDTYVIHMWNKLSSGHQVQCGEKVPYMLFAEKFCPKVFQQCREYF